MAVCAQLYPQDATTAEKSEGRHKDHQCNNEDKHLDKMDLPSGPHTGCQRANTSESNTHRGHGVHNLSLDHLQSDLGAMNAAKK